MDAPQMERRGKLGLCTITEHGHVPAGSIVWIADAQYDEWYAGRDGVDRTPYIVPALLEEGIAADGLPFTLGRIVHVDIVELHAHCGDSWADDSWLISFGDIGRLSWGAPVKVNVPLTITDESGEELGSGPVVAEEVRSTPGEKPECPECGKRGCSNG